MVTVHYDWPKEAEEIQRTKIAVGETTFAWGTLENTLVSFLCAILQRTDQDAIASAIYFAPSNLETRFKIIDATVRERLYKHAVQKEFLATWSDILNTLNRLKDTRNKIAHGSLIATLRGTPDHLRRVVRLSSQTRDVQRRRKSKESGQLPGMSPSDVESHAEAVKRLNARVERFRDLFWSLNTERTQTLLQVLSELGENPQK